MIIYKIKCEWEMPIANGYFSTEEKALQAIKDEDWKIVDYDSFEDAMEDGLVNIKEIKVK